MPGDLLSKHGWGERDIATIEQLRENPYLQYFCGFEQTIIDQANDTAGRTPVIKDAFISPSFRSGRMSMP